MPSFHTLRIHNIRKETEDSISLSFIVPQELREAFRFVAGQHIGVRCILEGREVRRNYSMCCKAGADELRIAIKKVPGGVFSTFAHEQLRPGDSLELMTPSGRFRLEPDARASRHIVAFAAGSGITPVLSMLITLLEGEPDSRFTLFYGNSRIDTIMFLEELEALKNRFMDRFRLHHILSRQQHIGPLFSGRIDAIRAGMLLDHLVDIPSADAFYLCGPYPMIEAVKASLLEREVPEARIHHELFAPFEDLEKHPQPEMKKHIGRGKIGITLDGHVFEVPVQGRAATILEHAQHAGVDLPFACKGGVCSTCRALLEKGSVDMPVNYALEDEERESGYILTCQSYPSSENLMINFDA